MNKTERAWLAGIIDGEGSISISDRRRDGRWFRLDLDIGMTHETTIDYIFHLTDLGNKGQRDDGDDRHAICHLWRASGEDAQIILKQVLPFLVTKRQQALIALEFPIPPKLTAREVSLGQKVDLAVRKTQEARYTQMRIANA
mgnify:CR=1 FL=1